MRKSICSALFVSSVLLLGACGSSTQNASTGAATSASGSSTEVDGATKVAELVKTFPKKEVKSVVTTSVSIAEMFDILNIKPIGLPTTNHALPAKFDSITKIGTAVDPDIEKIVSLHPDLVISAISIHTNLEKKIKNTKLDATFLPTDSYDDLKASFEALGTALNKKEAAHTYLEKLTKQEKEIIASNDATKKKVMLLFGSGESFMLMNENTYVGSLVHKLGAKNIVKEATTSKEAYVPMNMEDVVATNPDVILLVTHGDADVVLKQFKDEVKKNGAWNALNAFKNDQVSALDYNTFGYASLVHAPKSMKELQAIFAK